MLTQTEQTDTRNGSIDILLERIGHLEEELRSINDIAAMANRSIRSQRYEELEDYRQMLEERLHGPAA